MKERKRIATRIQNEVPKTAESACTIQHFPKEDALKVLVIDDTQRHIDAAIQQFKGVYDLTVCMTYDEAVKLLEVPHDETKRKELYEKYKAEEGDSFSAIIIASDKAEMESRLPYWDIVLTDLLMPASSEQLAEPKKYAGVEAIVGWSLALVAASRGAKYVAVGTDADHHQHPASAMLDRICQHVFSVDNSKFVMSAMRLVNLEGTEHTCPQCGGKGKVYSEEIAKEFPEEDPWCRCYHCKKGVAIERGKDWAALLSRLMKSE